MGLLGRLSDQQSACPAGGGCARDNTSAADAPCPAWRAVDLCNHRAGSKVRNSKCVWPAQDKLGDMPACYQQLTGSTPSLGCTCTSSLRPSLAATRLRGCRESGCQVPPVQSSACTGSQAQAPQAARWLAGCSAPYQVVQCHREGCSGHWSVGSVCRTDRHGRYVSSS